MGFLIGKGSLPLLDKLGAVTERLEKFLGNTPTIRFLPDSGQYYYEEFGNRFNGGTKLYPSDSFVSSSLTDMQGSQKICIKSSKETSLKTKTIIKQMEKEKKVTTSKQFRIGQKTLDAIGVNPEHPKFRSIVEGMLIAFNECKAVTKKMLATEFTQDELIVLFKSSSEVIQYANSINKKNLFLVTISEQEKNLPLAHKFNENANKVTAVFINAIVSEAFRDGKNALDFAREMKQNADF